MSEVFVNGESADASEVGSAPQAGPDEVDEAVKAAREAFLSRREVSAGKRGAALQTADAVMASVDEFAPLLTAEQGKPLREARLEIRRFAHTLEHYAGMAKNIRGGYVPDLYEGTYGAIVPWSFPATLLGDKLGPALIARSAVVAKPAETTPLTTIRIAEIMHRAGLPAWVFNVVSGKGSVAGEALIKRPIVRKTGFTGSTPVGKGVMAGASETLKRVTLELGGSDPMIVCDGANLDRAASAASVGRFFNCGQACLAVKRVFESVADEFVEKLSAKVKKLRVGPGAAEGVMLEPLHTSGQRDLLEDQIQSAVDSGAKRPEGNGEYEKGNFYSPTLLLEPARDSKVATEEVFGPAPPVWSVEDMDEALELANSTEFGLEPSIWTRDLNRASEAAERIEAGHTWIDSPQIAYDELPFGGWKESGYGKEHRTEALDFHAETKPETKAVVVRRAE